MKQNFLFLKIMAALLVFSSYLVAQNKPILQSQVITNKVAIDRLVESVINAMNAEGSKIGIFVHAVNSKNGDPRARLLSGYGDSGIVDIGAKDFFIEHFRQLPPSTYKKYVKNKTDKDRFYYKGDIAIYGEEKGTILGGIAFGQGNQIAIWKNGVEGGSSGFLVAPKLEQTLLKMCMYLQEAEIQKLLGVAREVGVSEEDIQKELKRLRKQKGLLDIKLEAKLPESGKPEVDDQPEKEEGKKVN